MALFVLMGFITFYSKMSTELYAAAYKWIGRLPGGLAMATVVACGCFGAITGSGTAGTAAMGVIALPEMEKNGYDQKLASGCIAAGGTVGSLIPPSVGFIIYALLADQSIGKLFVAGIIPGVMSVLIYMVLIYGMARIMPQMGPPAPYRTSFVEKMASLKSIWAMVLLFMLVIGGIYGGIFTATEGGGIGAFGAFIIGLARRKLSRKDIVKALEDSVMTVVMLFTILIGAKIFGVFIATSQLPNFLGEYVAGLTLPPIMILLCILGVWLLLGCVMPIVPMILLTLPIFLPIANNLGFNLIWFGVLQVMMVEIAAVTPPIGVNLFVFKSVAPHISMATIYRGVIFFICADIVRVGLIVAFPALALWLPNILR
jgi:tripartite ATP-independent transporter DctM subunit